MDMEPALKILFQNSFAEAVTRILFDPYLHHDI